jgi:uncharacterized protein (DUF779 family)
MNKIARVLSTAAANQIIDQLRSRHSCELMFHQSGGCCDGSAPMCFEKGEFRIGSQDVWIGTIHGCDFFMTADQFDYWKHTQLILDVTPGRGSSFSIEIPLGVRFLIRSRLFTMEELENLDPVKMGDQI